MSRYLDGTRMPNSLGQSQNILPSEPFDHVEHWDGFESLVQEELDFLRSNATTDTAIASLQEMDQYLETADDLNNDGQVIFKKKMRGSFMPGQIEIKSNEIFPKKLKVVAHSARANDKTGIPDFYIYDVKSAFCRAKVTTTERTENGKQVRGKFKRSGPKKFVHTELMVSMHVHDHEIPAFAEDQSFFNALLFPRSDKKNYVLELVRQQVNFMAMHEVTVGFLATDTQVRFLCRPFGIQAEPTGTTGGTLWISKSYPRTLDCMEDGYQSSLMGYIMGVLCACIRGTEMWPEHKVSDIHQLYRSTYFSSGLTKVKPNFGDSLIKASKPTRPLLTSGAESTYSSSSSDVDDFMLTLAIPKVSEIHPDLAYLARMHQKLAEKLDMPRANQLVITHVAADNYEQLSSAVSEAGAEEFTEAAEASTESLALAVRPATFRWPNSFNFDSTCASVSDMENYKTAVSEAEDGASFVSAQKSITYDMEAYDTAVSEAEDGASVVSAQKSITYSTEPLNHSYSSATLAANQIEIPENRLIVRPGTSSSCYSDNSSANSYKTSSSQISPNDSEDDTILNTESDSDNFKGDEVTDTATECDLIQTTPQASNETLVYNLRTETLHSSSDEATEASLSINIPSFVSSKEVRAMPKAKYLISPEVCTSHFPGTGTQRRPILASVMVELQHKKQDGWYDMCESHTLSRNNNYVPAKLEIRVVTSLLRDVTHSYDVVIKRGEYSHTHHGLMRKKSLEEEVKVLIALDSQRHIIGDCVPKFFCFGDVWRSHKMIVMEPWGRPLQPEDLCPYVYQQMEHCLHKLHQARVLLHVFQLQVFGIAPDSSVRVIDLRWALQSDKVSKKTAEEEIRYLQHIYTRYTGQDPTGFAPWTSPSPKKSLGRRLLDRLKRLA